MRFLCTKGKLEQRVLETYIKAFLCEPTNEVLDKDKSYQYLYTFPTELPLYLKEFAAEENNGDDGTTDISNKKDNNKKKRKKDKRMIYMKCYGKEALTPFDMNANDDVSDIQRLRDELMEKGVDLPLHATTYEIQDMYESCIIQKQLSMHENLSSWVLFPVRPSEVLDGKDG
eukprot:9020048-Ditylum_brightwellii.AAC.2